MAVLRYANVDENLSLGEESCFELAAHFKDAEQRRHLG